MSLLLMGLGNPGLSYKKNRHNVGFLALDSVSKRYAMSAWKAKYESLYSQGYIHDQKITLIKPQTYMNLSGRVVLPFLNWMHIKRESLLVIHDDLMLPFLHLRVKQGGGAGGHNGLRSVDQHIGNQYLRLRIGIGRPKEDQSVAEHVLSDFSDEEYECLAQRLWVMSEKMPLLLENKIDHFLTSIL
jgi:PTH1 family peptidyl-tRNA hydrolase